MIEGQTIRLIRDAVAGGRVPVQFRAADINNALAIRFAGTFLPKHCNGNPGNNSVLFNKLDRGLYRLKK
jgi:hypothetical protein